MKPKFLKEIKIGSFGDPHLTNNLPYTKAGDSYRKDAIKNFIKYSFNRFIKEDVGLVVVPGDLCHATKLDSNDLDLLIYFLERSRISNIPTVIIPGNHDLDQEDCILEFINHYKVGTSIYYSQGGSGVWNFSYPITEADFVRVVGVGFCSDKDFLEYAKREMQKKRETYNILIAHVGIKGTLHGSTKSIYGIKKEDLEKLEEGYDLMIFAHHHLTQRITSKSFYCGSIQQTRIDEIDHKPGSIIFSLPSLKLKKIVNTFSPRFKMIENYHIRPSEITGNIIKPVLDLQRFTEEINLEFIKKVSSYDPYYLIKPSLKTSFGKELKLRFKVKKNDPKTLVLKKVLEETSKTVPSKRTKKFNKHVLSLYRKVGEK